MYKKLICICISFLFLMNSAQSQELDENKMNWHLSAGAIPLFGIRTPSRDTPAKEDDINSEVKNGYGFHFNFGLEILEPLDSENMSLGWFLDYTHTDHDVRKEEYQISFHQFHFECAVLAILIESKHIKLKHIGTAGAGLVITSFNDDSFEKFTTGSVRIKYLIDFEFYRHYSIQFGGGLFMWGEPGRTQAYGGFLQSSINIHF